MSILTLARSSKPAPVTASAWTRETFRQWLSTKAFDRQVIVVSNREPISHELGPDGAAVPVRSFSGVVNAVEPMVAATTSAVWIAAGTGAADGLVPLVRDGFNVNTAGHYRLRRVWLTADEETAYYEGCANEALWPLCHRAHVRPTFRPDDLAAYWAVNDRFAQAVREEARDDRPVVLVQDYHFALAPALIRERLPDATIVLFWHIPWPDWQTFATCPWRDQLLSGLLAADILTFQTAVDSRNFLETVSHCAEACVNHDDAVVTVRRRRVLVRHNGASIVWEPQWLKDVPPADVCRVDVRRALRLGSETKLAVSVDRIDYTKGLEEKLFAIERLLTCYPAAVGQFTFVQLAQPSRERIPEYQHLRARLHRRVEQLNARFGTGVYRPVFLLEGNHAPTEITRFFRAADVCYVGSIHDGMNLVAKEFVRARDDLRGVLLLSEFTGAARELRGPLVVNPYDVDRVAHLLTRACNMPPHRQRARMQQMRVHVAEFSAYRWAERLLDEAMRLGRDRRRRPHVSAATVVRSARAFRELVNTELVAHAAQAR